MQINITDKQFNEALENVIDDDNLKASNLLSIPGVYEILAEYYNNEVIDNITPTIDQRREIAQQFVDMHKDNDLEGWYPFGVPDWEKLDRIYQSLVGGVYGHLEEEHPGEFTIEIDSTESKSGNTILFFFEAV